MSTDNRFAGLLGPWPPSGPAPLPDPTQGQMNGVLLAQPTPQPTMGLLEVPGDPSSLFGPSPFDPMQRIAGGQDPAGASAPLDPGSWLRAPQALHASLGDKSPLSLFGATPAGYGPTWPSPTSSAINPAAIAPMVKGGDLLSVDPSRLVANFKPSGLVQIQAPSPHAGDYATSDEAAKAGQADIPNNSADEYGTWLTKHQVPITFPDIGNGPVPFLLDRFSYPGLFTSNDPDKVLFGSAPADAIGWLHNHPYSVFDPGNDNAANINPSPAEGSRGDWYFVHQIQKTNPGFETYIDGPDGVLRRFQHSNEDMAVVK